ncbi:L-type lectin-domain containing protein [Actinoplanes sp. NPDC051851]|uniref:L-type lectin-domain containing protein n=1 Tax=Actinoplanes sp. NPDC051851 TaxID=3154753 RepID=UPI0034138F28
MGRFGPWRERVLRLTSGGHQQMGAAWATHKVDLRRSFETTFDAFLHEGRSGADGIAIVLQTEGTRALGGWGGGLGYRGIRNSVAIEFDDFKNAPDPSDNHVGLVVNGNPDAHLVTADPDIPLFGAPFRARVGYDARSHHLQVHVGTPDQGEPEQQLVIDQRIDLAGRLGAGSAWAGFTGATGDVVSQQDILSWEVSARPPAPRRR